MNSIGQKYCYGGEKAWMLMVSVMLIVLVSCGGKASSGGLDASGQEESQFHADFDIAMTVCSIVEPLPDAHGIDNGAYSHGYVEVGMKLALLLP